MTNIKYYAKYYAGCKEIKAGNTAKEICYAEYLEKLFTKEQIVKQFEINAK